MLPHISAVLEKIALEECSKSVYRVKSIEESADSGFHGKIHTVELEGNGGTLALVLKTCPTDPFTREVQKTHDKFLNEVAFYSDIAGKLRRYDDIPRIPKYYGSCCDDLQEALVLEDLRKEGFEMRTLSGGLDSKHLRLVAQALAKLHRASIKWRKEDPGDFEKTVSVLKETTFCQRADPNDRRVANLLFVQACQMGLKCAEVEQSCSRYVNQSMIDRLDRLETWVEPEDGELIALLHGDSWCHNFLFTYNENREPTEVALIDWQMLKVGSPALDLLECFLSSADPEAVVAPSTFLDCYSLESQLGITEVSRDFAKWGAPALLLVLAIVVNFAEKDSLSVKFNDALKEGGFKNELNDKTESRIRTIMHTAKMLGIFAKYDAA